MEFCPASSSSSAAADKPLSWTFVPFSTCKNRRSFCVQRASHRSPRFRLQGLVTLLTVLSRRIRAGFVSYRQRSWDSPFGAFPSRTVLGAFPPERTHVPILHPVHNAARGDEAGPDDRGFWALARAGVPCGCSVISATTAGCSLGLFPFQGIRAAKFAERPRLPLSSLPPFSKAGRGCATESRVSPLGPTQSRTRGTVGSDSLLRVSAPVRSEAFESCSRRAMCSPHVAMSVAAPLRRSEAKPNSLLTLPRTVGGAEPSATSTSRMKSNTDSCEEKQKAEFTT